MADIFICYRRADSEASAGRLHDRLESHFGARAVFVDVDNLYPGVDFAQVIERTVLRAKIVLVVIGPHWLDPRLRNEGDYVRREIIAALKGSKRVIPVLVGNATMPAPEMLPPELAALAGKHAVSLRHASWKTDVDKLVRSLERTLAAKKRSARQASGSGGKRKSARTAAPRGKAQDAVPAAQEKSAKKKRSKSGAPGQATPVSKGKLEPAKPATGGNSSVRRKRKPEQATPASPRKPASQPKRRPQTGTSSPDAQSSSRRKSGPKGSATASSLVRGGTQGGQRGGSTRAKSPKAQPAVPGGTRGQQGKAPSSSGQRQTRGSSTSRGQSPRSRKA